VSDTLHVLGISGSLRRASWNTGLLRAAAELLPPGMSFEVFDLAPIPLYNQELDTPEHMPAAVRQLKDRIAAADALLLATPEYNYSVSGVLKNAIDWASRPRQSSPLLGKPAAIASVGGRFGGVRAQLHLRQIGLELGLQLLGKPELIVPAGWEKFDAAGNLTHDPTRHELRALLEALAAWTARLRA
jgi:chromate reductase, NAD(P)H dehydrogenase (quinone)